MIIFYRTFFIGFRSVIYEITNNETHVSHTSFTDINLGLSLYSSTWLKSSRAINSTHSKAVEDILSIYSNFLAS